MENFMRGIDEISRPDGGRRFRIDNLLKNFGGKVLSLEDKSHARFGVLIDTHGTAYLDYRCKIQAGYQVPEASVEGYMIHVLPEDPIPGYIPSHHRRTTPPLRSRSGH